MSTARFEPSEILRRLVGRGVDFVIIGGVAAVMHGSPRHTYDLDISFALDDANLTALGEVLVGLNARLRGVPDDVPFVPDGKTLKRADVLTLETEAGAFDVLARPAGAPPYDTLRANADRMEAGGVRVLVASPTDLIAMKRAAGRPKDLGDIAELEVILKLRAEEGGA